MSVHLTRDLELLHDSILAMGAIAAEIVHRGVNALYHPDHDATRLIDQIERQVDESDVQIEDACLKILALHQPIASDLRRVTAVLKIGNELERVADLGVNVAERAVALANLPQIPIPAKLNSMAQKSLEMLDSSIAAYVALDSRTARAICADDDAIDQLNDQIIAELKSTMKQSPSLIEPAMHLFSACRIIERIADHATNIAEDVIYLVEGDIVRHRPEISHPSRYTA